jgi:Effector-associated domain 1
MDGRMMGEICDALVGAFTPDTLRQMVRFRLNRQLDALAKPGNFRVVVFELVETADREGWVNDLLAAAIQANPGNEALQQFAGQSRSAAAEAKKPSGATAGEEERLDLFVRLQNLSDTGPALIARLYNPCSVAVRTTGVMLYITAPGTKQRTQILYFWVQGGLPLPFGFTDIPPHQEIPFIMEAREYPFFSEREPVIGEHSHIVVWSWGGEHARFEGDGLIRMLHKLVEYMRATPPPPRRWPWQE